MTKYQGNYEETARNLPPNGKASGMYVANDPSPCNSPEQYSPENEKQLILLTYYGLQRAESTA